MLAQNPHPYFRNFTTEHGLPSSEVHYALEDDKGYMWFATDNGVSRFDGYSFKNFGPKEGLKHHVAFFLQKASDGVIWIATMNGHLYFVKGEEILPFEQNDLIEKYGQNGNVLFDFYIDPFTETKYISILGSGVLTFSKDHTFRYLKNTSNQKISLIKDNRWTSDRSLPLNLSLQKPKALSNVDFGIPIVEMVFDTIKTEEGILEKEMIASNFGHLNFQDSSNLFFYSNYLYEKIVDSLRMITLSDFKFHDKSIFWKKNGTAFIGCQNGNGVKRFKNSSHLLSGHYDQFLSGKSITHIFKDSKNTYWISTIEHGVFYTSNFEQKIFDTSIGLSSDYISALAFKNENELFIGLRDGNLFLLNIATNQLTKLVNPFRGKNIIYDLLYDGKRAELWMTNEIISYFKDGIWTKVDYISPLTDRPISLIGRKMSLRKNSPLLWGTAHNIFSAIDLEGKTKKMYSPELGIMEQIFVAKESSDGRVWIGSGRGLLEFKNDKITSPIPFHKAFESRIEDLDELADTTLVIATKGEGVLLWKGNYFQQFTKADGLSSDMIENIHVDSFGKIWAGTLEGLNIITPVDSGYQIKSYTMWHGLPSNEITQVRSYGKQVWVGTSKGLMQWTEPEPTKKIPQPIIEKVLVNDDEFLTGNKDVFSASSNNFKFHFLSINYRMPAKIPYRFRLNKSSWNITQNRSASYTNLVPGKYSFEVQSQTEDGKWSAAANYQFTIQPPWWTTWWFRGLLVLSIGGFAFGWYRNRTKIYRKENALLQEINQLERKALQAQMNPHFIFNSLNSIQYAILQKDNDQAVAYLTKFASFTRWVLKSSADGKVVLEEEINFLENYLSLEKLRFKNRFDYHFEIDKKLSLSNTYVLPLMIQPIVENAIQHGMKGKKSNGKINLIFTDAEDRIYVKIRDNGDGFFPAKNKSRIYQPMGMSITKRRLEVAGEDVPMKFTTLKDQDGNIEGTEVGFFLKKI